MSEKLEAKLREVDPDQAKVLVGKYKIVMDEIDKASVPQAEAEDAKSRLKILSSTIVKSNVGRRRELMTAFDEDLTDVAISLGIEFEPSVDLPKETPPGFAERPEESDMEEVLRGIKSDEAKAIFIALAEELGGPEVSEERQRRVEQLSILVTALEGLKHEIENSAGVGEDVLQIVEFDVETRNRSGKIDSLIFNLKQLGLKAILKDGLSIDDMLEKYGDLFGNKVKKLLKSFDEAHGFFDENGRLRDIKDEKEKTEYYFTLFKFLRSRHDYATAQAIMEEILLKDVFEQSKKTIEADRSLSTKLEDKAAAYIGKKFDESARGNTREKITEELKENGMSAEQIAGYDFTTVINNYRDNVLVPIQLKRMQNQYAAEHLVFYENQEYSGSDSHRHMTIQDPPLSKFWHEYDTMLDPKGKAFELSDEIWDLILEELIITAPMIIISGGVAGAIAKGLSWGARLALSATRVAIWGERLAVGGRIARGTLGMAKLGGRAASLVTEAFFFEMSFLGLQGELFIDQPEWVKQTLWTAATLGAFKFAGKLGEASTLKFGRLLTEVAPKLGNNNFVKIVEKLLIQGHYQVAAMLVINGVQHLSEGEFQEFWDNFGYQLFRAYVSVGALTIAGGVVKTAGGKIFKPGSGGGSKRGRTAVNSPEAGSDKLPKGGRTARREVSDERGTSGRGTLARVRDIVESGESAEVGCKNGGEITGVFAHLTKAGFEITRNPDGSFVAARGRQTIAIKPSSRVTEAFNSVRNKVSSIRKILAGAGNKLTGGAVNRLLSAVKGVYNDLLTAGFSRVQALAGSLVLLSGCSDIKAAGHGAGNALGGLLNYGLPGAGGIVGTYLLLSGIIPVLGKGKARKAVEKASEIFDKTGDFTSGTETAADVSTSITKAMTALRELSRKINDPHTKSRMNLVIREAKDILIEMKKTSPDNAVLERLSTKLNDAISGMILPEANHFTLGNGLRLAVALALLSASALWLHGGIKYKIEGDKDDDDDDDDDVLPIISPPIIAPAPNNAGSSAPAPAVPGEEASPVELPPVELPVEKVEKVEEQRRSTPDAGLDEEPQFEIIKRK